MATATSLDQAAGQAFENLFPIWTVGNNILRFRLISFAQDALTIFPVADANGTPIANWAVLITGLAAAMPQVVITIPPILVPYDQLVTAADYVSRICFLASGGALFSQSVLPPNITNAQRNALLDSYNAQF